MILRFGFLVLGATILVSCASLVAPQPVAERAALRGGAYTLDPAHASVIFKIDHLGFSTYVGRFEALDASLDFEVGKPETARLEAHVEIASLDIANDEFAETLIGSDWFDAETFPQATFQSKAITVTGDNTGTMTGALTLKGETREVMFDVVFNGGDRDLIRGAYVVGFSAKGVIDRTAFGIDRFSGVVGNNVVLEIEAEFLKQ